MGLNATRFAADDVQLPHLHRRGLAATVDTPPAPSLAACGRSGPGGAPPGRSSPGTALAPDPLALRARNRNRRDPTADAPATETPARPARYQRGRPYSDR